MKEPFDIELEGVTYSVFPEEEDIYAIFKEGVEHVKIQRDTESNWLKLDAETETPLFDNDEEVNRIGKAIESYQPDNEEDHSTGDNHFFYEIVDLQFKRGLFFLNAFQALAYLSYLGIVTNGCNYGNGEAARYSSAAKD